MIRSIWSTLLLSLFCSQLSTISVEPNSDNPLTIEEFQQGKVDFLMITDSPVWIDTRLDTILIRSPQPVSYRYNRILVREDDITFCFNRRIHRVVQVAPKEHTVER